MSEGSTSRLAALYPQEWDPVPIVQEAGWAPVSVWTGVEYLPPPPKGFDLRSLRPVASRYTDSVTRPTNETYLPLKKSVTLYQLTRCRILEYENFRQHFFSLKSFAPS